MGGGNFISLWSKIPPLLEFCNGILIEFMSKPLYGGGRRTSPHISRGREGQGGGFPHTPFKPPLVKIHCRPQFKLIFSQISHKVTFLFPFHHSCMPSPLAPDPIRVQSCVSCLLRNNRNSSEVTSIYLFILS